MTSDSEVYLLFNILNDVWGIRKRASTPERETREFKSLMTASWSMDRLVKFFLTSTNSSGSVLSRYLVSSLLHSQGGLG